MGKILLGAVGMLGLGSLMVAALVQFGLLDFAADQPHAAVVHRLVEWAREQSIARRAADVVRPADLSEAGRIRRGAGNYEAMCVSCHLAPGVEDSEIRKGLYPPPLDLARSVGATDSAATDGRRFWIIKHGIKGSGMPAWSKGGMDDEAIWDLTAFLKVLPALSPAEYRSRVAASDGHSHEGMSEQHGQPKTQPSPAHHHSKPHAPHVH
ncbi:c-type cytochrome [Azonexus sp. IMCC34842]|uniref:c-type cytochrome n=1 Tax=Azonexus sp. IMCC34842 TaxID=3420950 RepID=UPI003D0D7290